MCWHAEHGDDGPRHGPARVPAQQSRQRRRDLPVCPRVEPDLVLRADDDSDWFVGPSCDAPDTRHTGGDTYGALLAGIGSHRCDPAGRVGKGTPAASAAATRNPRPLKGIAGFGRP
ncbi:hypothetical protein GCM10010170_039000 [Dactylosporangium salmoneum]|uniref:Uncharacterized protein n=1 Tax=Dactylosporangium salmoneum TaxID=53361 RepID=A0ABN3GEF5_9ACTN